MRKKSAARIVCVILSVLIFLFGLTVYIYPFANRAITSANISENLDDFRYVRTPESNVTDYGDDSTTPESTNKNQKSESDIHKYDELYEAMAEYNEQIYKENQSGLKDAWSYEQAEFDLTKYGIYNNIIAELRVPSMDCDLPLYLGATWSNMAWGAVQLGQTSMPIGGENTNCVIAGHRGCTNGRYFLDIENVKIGDKVYIDNLWGTLTYKVTKIDVISPDDIDKILIQEGKDMVTLITCHPYPYNYQRYVVYCERTSNDASSGETVADGSSSASGAASETSAADAAAQYDDGSQAFIKVENVLVYAVPTVLVLLAVVLFVITSEKRKRHKKRE